MTACPKCGSIELRVHGARSHVSFVRRWKFIGRKVPRGTPVALEVSCAHCLFSFVVRDGGISEAPMQTAYDDLVRVKAAIKDNLAQGKGRNASEDEKPVPRLSPRPAPDPRVKQRR